MAYPRTVLKDTTNGNQQGKYGHLPMMPTNSKKRKSPDHADKQYRADVGVLSPHNHSGDDDDDDNNAWLKARKQQGNNTTIHHHKRRKSVLVPDSDRVARQNCFDYLVTAIDEVWAQYCDCTSSAESKLYEEDVAQQQPRHMSFSESDKILPNSPVSLCGEEDQEDEYSSGPETPPIGNKQKPRSKSVTVAAFDQPKSIKLLNLKKRLLNAKYFLSDLAESLDPLSSSEFWHRWDMIKYATIELVEEDGDDDETVEAVTDELEEGRYYR